MLNLIPADDVFINTGDMQVLLDAGCRVGSYDKFAIRSLIRPPFVGILVFHPIMRMRNTCTVDAAQCQVRL